jgi:signal transduction histidine kinase
VLFPKIKTRIIVIISVILLLLISTMIYSIYSINQLKKNLGIQVQSRTIIVNLKSNLINLLNAETGERGFVITGDETYLEPYKKSIQEILKTKNNLREFARNNRLQKNHLDSLEKYIDLKVAYIEKIIQLKRNGEETTMTNLLKTNIGKQYMDKIRDYNFSMQEKENAIYDERKNITYASLVRSKNIFIAEGIFAILITFFLALTILSELKRRMATEVQLKNKNSELERKNYEIEQFAYISAHDLQEPLRSISNFSILLSEKIDSNQDRDVKNYMQKIIGASGRMSNLINDLLEYSRLGKDMVMTKIDCTQLIFEIQRDLVFTIKESGAKIEFEKMPVITGHQSLKSLFQNLITNAIKFRKKGVTPEIKISCAQTTKEFIFSFSDNGIGIDKQYFERIFTIFQRLHTREEYKGTGIGLAQCKKIVELHGGRIWVTSTPEIGSTFHFTISKTQ